MELIWCALCLRELWEALKECLVGLGLWVVLGSNPGRAKPHAIYNLELSNSLNFCEYSPYCPWCLSSWPQTRKRVCVIGCFPEAMFCSFEYWQYMESYDRASNPQSIPMDEEVTLWNRESRKKLWQCFDLTTSLNWWRDERPQGFLVPLDLPGDWKIKWPSNRVELPPDDEIVALFFFLHHSRQMTNW